MDNFTALTEADLRDMLADLQLDFGTERNDIIDCLAWEILEELTRRELEAMDLGVSDE